MLVAIYMLAGVESIWDHGDAPSSPFAMRAPGALTRGRVRDSVFARIWTALRCALRSGARHVDGLCSPGLSRPRGFPYSKQRCSAGLNENASHRGLHDSLLFLLSVREGVAPPQGRGIH